MRVNVVKDGYMPDLAEGDYLTEAPAAAIG